ncbi:Carbohydrate sulfotransferase 12 [Sciurus carolinensis]|uniref:Carbohydrate sulfotransferase n=1 Tax=Sciurus carolinensis TaxID=30640 RepID=A0AA41T9A2_SCICA|nr:Carbohydrate sulfotransferase 12 [Sciurus carolinensis]
MKIKLKKYTKFLLVCNPFLQPISAFRIKFKLENEEFNHKFLVPMQRLYPNHTTLPTSVSEAFSTGLRCIALPPMPDRLRLRGEAGDPGRGCRPAPETSHGSSTSHLMLPPPEVPERTVSSWEENWFAKILLAWRQKLYKLYEAHENLLRD